MPKTPNYNFQKRQKEMAREQKREAKAKEKRERKEAGRAGAPSDDASTDEAGADVELPENDSPV